MPITQDRMINMIETADFLIRFQENIGSLLGNVPEIISNANAALAHGDIKSAHEILVAELMTIYNVVKENPLPLRFYGYYLTEKNHFAKRKQFNDRSADAMRRSRRSAAERGPERAPERTVHSAATQPQPQVFGNFTSELTAQSAENIYSVFAEQNGAELNQRLQSANTTEHDAIRTEFVRRDELFRVELARAVEKRSEKRPGAGAQENCAMETKNAIL